MQLARLLASWSSRTHWEKAALVVWSVILLVIAARVVWTPTRGTVYPIFSASSQLWWNSRGLYEPQRPEDVQTGYRYSPTFAILLTPCALLPDTIGGILWRLLSVAGLLASLNWLARCVLPVPLSRDQFAQLTLLSLPLGLSSISNGQANVIVSASLLAAVAAVKQQRWNLATIMIAIGFLCKIYPLSLGMVLILLYPRQLLWRVPIGIAATLLLPFLLQKPGYVMEQYQGWLAALQADDRTKATLINRYRDLWLLIDLYAIPLSRNTYVVLQILGGAALAALSWYRQRSGWPERALLTSTLALVSTWMLLLGPASETSTFSFLAIPLAWSILAAIQRGVWDWRTLLLTTSSVLFLLAVLAGGVANTARLNLIAIHSWATLLYLVHLLAEVRPSAAETHTQTVTEIAKRTAA